jgi:carbonic anhydrase
MMSGREALERLREGNRRFASGAHEAGASWDARRAETAQKQEPFAVVLGCADSRVPVELVFDQGLGDLFVIRVAGNVAGPSQIGSVEYAVEHLGTRLVVVLGHSRCGAVQATLDAIGQPAESLSPSLQSIVECVRPAVEPLLGATRLDDRAALVAQCVRANVRTAVDQLCEGSPSLEGLIRSEGLLVVGAEYSLDTGEVDFLDPA